jgi:hypothetical protein
MKRIFALLLTVSVIAGIALPSPAFATTQVLTVASEGNYTIGTYVGGAATFANLNIDDGDTTRLNFPDGHSGESEFHTYSMSAFVTANDGINSVTLYVNARSISDDVNLKPVCRISNIDYLGAEWNLTTLNYELNSYTWTLNPSTGTAWTAAAINSAEFGFNRPALYESRVTFMYLIVDYNSTGALAVDTNAATSISETFAMLNGEVTEDGGQTIDWRGFVWDTTSRADPGNVVPPATYSDNWTEGGGNYGENPFTDNVTTLATGLIYYYRAFAHNATGWEYGDEETFTTLGNPSISSVAVTYLATTSVRLNALVNSDGGQACDVRFGYDTVSRSCDFVAPGEYTNITVWVENTYLKGQTPYVDITGLVAGTPYYFCVQIRNDVSSQTGGELTFTTTAGVNKPTDFKAVPTANEVSLSWVKGAGSTETLIRYKLGTYPTSKTDGTLVYLGSETAFLHSDLLPGTTYFYIAWGKSGTTYSTDNATLMATTLAGSSTTGMFGSVTTPSWWFGAPDYTRMNQFPFYGLINQFSDAYKIPRSTFWFLLAMMISIGAGAGIYMWASSFKAPIAFAAEAGFMSIGTVMGLISGWLVFVFIIFAIATLVVGTRL